MNLLDAIEDEALFGPWFKDRETWVAWTAFIAALFGLPMTPEQEVLYRKCTGRIELPSGPAAEGWLTCGRRAGKSFILALIAVYLACFRDYRPYLAPGEVGTVVVIATDRRQARTIVRYVRGLLHGVPMLKALVERETSESFGLSTRVTIEVATASFRKTRGYTIVAACCDEIAFWYSEGAAEPDFEILDALRPGMATIPGALLLCASSPYAKRGALHDAVVRHYGKAGPILVWKAPTRVMNPTVPQRVIDEALERDPAWARAEYLAEFRDDVAAFITREAIAACIQAGVHERLPERRNRYVAFVDPSGGASDSMTLAIAHKEGDTAILDCVREREPPFSPEGVVEEFAELCRRYRICRVHGDRYAGEWPREQFSKRGITYTPAEKSKSELYIDFLPLVNSGAVDLLDHDKLVGQLANLERKTTRGKRDTIDHGPGAHDDIANAAAGALVAVTQRQVRSPGDFPAAIRVESVSGTYDVHCTT